MRVYKKSFGFKLQKRFEENLSSVGHCNPRIQVHDQNLLITSKALIFG